MNPDEQNLMIAELLIRVGALEKIIINKKICSVDELNAEVKAISDGVIKLLESKTNGVSDIRKQS